MLFFGNFWRGLLTTKQPARPARRRKLTTETLENRKLLAGDLADGDDFCEPAEAVGTIGEQQHEESQQANLAIPKIVEFRGRQLGDDARGIHWAFEGRVVDDGNVRGLTVSLGGLLGTESATTERDGRFVL